MLNSIPLVPLTTATGSGQGTAYNAGGVGPVSSLYPTGKTGGGGLPRNGGGVVSIKYKGHTAGGTEDVTFSVWGSNDGVNLVQSLGAPKTVTLTSTVPTEGTEVFLNVPFSGPPPFTYYFGVWTFGNPQPSPGPSSSSIAESGATIRFVMDWVLDMP